MITLHTLVPPENHDLFKRFPELNLIWENPILQAEARESYEEWDLRRYPGESSGEIFSIMEDDQAIGIIGWFEYAEAGADILRLRYYGIVPSRRKAGHGAIAMRLLLDRLTLTAPSGYVWLAESVSLNRPVAPRIIAHFESLGFAKFDDPKYGENANCGPTQSLRIKIPGK